MKFILELLTERGQTVVCGNRGEAITRLDSYPDHRPGQPIAAVYIKDGERKALLALGHDYGIGLEGSKRKYTVIGDVDATNSVTTTVTADQIKLREIDYSGLLDDIQQKVKDNLGVDSNDFHRFGWLGTVNDPWLSSLKVPNGASVQDAFDAILLGRLDHSDGDDKFQYTIIAESSYFEAGTNIIIVPSQGESAKNYTIHTIVDPRSVLVSDGTIQTSGGTTETEADTTRYNYYIKSFREYSQQFIIDSDFPVVKGEDMVITYHGDATVGSITHDGQCQVIIRRIDDPQAGKKYRIIYHWDTDSVPHDAIISNWSSTKHSQPLSPTSFWIAPTGYEFDGYTDSSQGGTVVPPMTWTQVYPEDPAPDTDYYETHVYAQIIPVTPSKIPVVVEANPQSKPYNAEDQEYTNSIIVKANGLTVPAAAYTVVWVPADGKPHGIDCTTYYGSVTVTINEEYDDQYEAPENPTQTSLTITPLTVYYKALINDKEHEDQLKLGDPVPTNLRGEITNLNELPSECSSMIVTVAWRNGTPDMNQPGTYYLDPSTSVISNNYVLGTPVSADMVLEDEPLTVTFTTFGYTNEPAVHQQDLSGTSFIHNTAGANGLTGDLNDWWLFDSYRKNQANHTTYIYSSKPITSRPEIKRWDSATSQWIIPTAELNNFTWSGNTVTFEHFNDIAEVWDTEHSLYAIKFN